jgi:hypothetical protein
MSEYQYYEFKAIERPLTAQEQAEIRKLSSRVELTPTQAVFLYNYGDFRGDPEKVLAQYFDLMFYIANWGTWQLIFRFPKAIVDPKWFQPYELENTITLSTTSKHVILNIHITEEEGLKGWVEGQGWMSRLAPLRDELLQGDLRLLYLVWLRSAPYLAKYVLEDDPIEPPVPPNLGQLSSALQAFVELVEFDLDWVAAAAQSSPPQAASSEPALETWLTALSESEKQEFLLKLVRRDPHVDLQLISRLKELAGKPQAPPQPTVGQRRLSELGGIAHALRTQQQVKEQQVAQTKRTQQLEALAPKEAQTWQRVVELIALKQAKPYDEATALLKDLRDLARHQGRSSEFDRRLEKLKADYQSRPSLLRRFQTISNP